MIILPYYTWIMQNPPVLPKLYWGAISQEQRLAEICRKVWGVEHYLKYLSDQVVELEDEIKAEVEEIIAESQAEIIAALKEFEDKTDDRIDQLIEWVESQTFSIQTWDVTRGLTTSSVDAMRRIFFDVTILGTTVKQLAESPKYPTVQALAYSGWNTRALAVIGARVLDHESDNTPWVVPGGGIVGAFNAGSLVTATVNDEGFLMTAETGNETSFTATDLAGAVVDSDGFVKRGE